MDRSALVPEAAGGEGERKGRAAGDPTYKRRHSEKVRRQIYGGFWFEKASARVAIDEYRDNILDETDFPHPTYMSPGPASAAEQFTTLSGISAASMSAGDMADVRGANRHDLHVHVMSSGVADVISNDGLAVPFLDRLVPGLVKITQGPINGVIQYCPPSGCS